MSYRPVLALALAAAVAAQARGQAPPPDLVNYVSKPDTSFAWKLVKSDATDAGTVHETDKDGTKELLPARAINTLSAFCKCQVFDKPMPAVDWKYSTEDDNAVLGAGVKAPVKGVRVWEAVSPTRDFRPARWNAIQTEKDVKALVAAVGRPATGFRAAFLEVEFDLDGLPFSLTSQMRVLEAKQ